MQHRQHYQDGTVFVRGKRVKKWAGRIRIYSADGKSSRPEIVLGLKANMTKSEAQAKLREEIIRRGGRPAPILHDITFGEYWREHYVPLRKVAWSEPTEAGYNGYMQAFILPAFENVALKDISPPVVANFFSDVQGRCGYWALKKIRGLLKAVFEEAVEDDLIPKNPVKRVPVPKTDEPSRPHLEKRDLARVLKALEPSPRDYAMTRTGVFCAVRSSELFGLTWDSYRGDHFVIHNSAWEGKLYEMRTKTGSRVVAIDSATQQAIERWRRQCPDKNPASLMWPSEAGTPFSSRNWLQRVLQPIGKELGIKTPLTLQVLRRTFATHNQQTLSYVQQHLGHEDVSMTTRIYTQRVPAEVRKMQEGYAAEIRRLVKLDGTGRKSRRHNAVSR